ncbi:MAG: bestrophin-like domain [Desulfobaccales bacterium]
MHPLPLLIISLTVALGVFFLVRIFRLEELFISEFNFINVVARIVGTIFGLFLAFTVILGWGRYTEARRNVFTEVASLSALWRNAAVFPPDARDRLHQQLVAYTKSVIQDEWPAMDQDQASPVTQQHYQKIWDFYSSFAPETENQKIFYRQSIRKLNALGENRRFRLLFCQTTFIFPLVVFLFFGGMVMVGLSYCFPIKSLWFHVLLITMVTLIIISSIYLAYELQNPFSGYIVLQPDPFQDLLADFSQRR